MLNEFADFKDLDNLKKYTSSCMGGTCDHLHSGHKIFFGAAALNTKKLMIGVTCQEMLGKKPVDVLNTVLEF